MPTELRATGFALEASLQEVFFVGGPLFVALLAAIHPVAALAGAAVAVALGTLALVRVPPVRDTRPDHAPGHVRSGALTAVGVRTILVLASFMGLSFGTVEVAMPAFAEQHGSRALAGLALASFSAGSLLGGLLAGLRPAREAAVMSGAMGSRRGTGGRTSRESTSPRAAAPARREGATRTRSAGVAWIGTAVTGGVAGGTAVGGWLVDAHGVRSAITFGVVTIVVGAVAVTLRRHSLDRFKLTLS